MSLIENVNQQLDRLIHQLADLEEMREELEEDEYEEMKADTLAQMEEFEKSLEKMKQGDLSLVGDLQHAQMAIQAAIRSAFKTPAVIKMFARKEPAQLRTRLDGLKRDEKLGKLGKDAYNTQAAEILTALKRLGETLEPSEEAFLQSFSSKGLSEFSTTAEGDGAHSGVLSTAAEQIQKSKK